MSTEEKLKNYILSKYKSIREFCINNNFAYSTVDSLFKRGLLGSSVSLVMKICESLGIDLNELSCGNIKEKTQIEISELTNYEKKLVHEFRQHPEMRSAVCKLLGITETSDSSDIADDMVHTVTEGEKIFNKVNTNLK